MFRIIIEAQGGLEGGQGQLINPEGAIERIFCKARHEILSADHDPRLGASQELVPGESHQIHARRHGRLHRRLVRQAMGGQIQE